MLSRFSLLDSPGRVLLPGSYVVGSTHISFINDEILDKVKEVTGNCSTEVCEFNQVKTILHSLKYGHLDGKHNSSICAFCNNRIEQMALLTVSTSLTRFQLQ